jgi:hypothetical protein
MTATKLKSDIWVASYGFPKFFGCSLVEGHVDPSRSYYPQAPTSTVEVHPPSNPTTGFDLHLTHKLQGSSAFNTSALNAPFSFLCTNPLESQNPEIPRCCHVAPAFGPFGSIRSNIPYVEEFDTSALNASFYFLRSLPLEPGVSKYFHVVPSFRPFTLRIMSCPKHPNS